MKPFARPKMSGTVTVRRFNPPQLETSARIKKGELEEPVEAVAGRVGLVPCAANGSGDPLFLVDEQELSIMGKLFDQRIYYLSGGSMAPADTVAAGKKATPKSAGDPGAKAEKNLPPDAAVAWAFDERVLLHQLNDNRSPETPYRLERAVERLRTAARAGDLLPRELLAPPPGDDSQRRGSINPSNRAIFISPRLATREEILSFQDPKVYAEFIDTGAALKNLKSDVYCNDETSSTAVKLSVAAVIDAGHLVLSAVSQARNASAAPDRNGEKEGTPHTASPFLAFCLVRPPGHHCGASQPSGFCLVNNVAIAAQQLLLGAPVRDGGNSRLPRIAIVDLDVHYGEGTVEFVDGWQPPTSGKSQAPLLPSAFPLLYQSLHRFDKGAFYPFLKSGSLSAVGTQPPGCICNVAVDTEAHIPAKCYQVISDFLVEEVMQGVFIPRLEAFRPDVVFVSLGFDAGYGDPLGKMSVEGGFASALSMLKQWCLYGKRAGGSPSKSSQHSPVGLVTVLEGGYNPETVAGGVFAVAQALTFSEKDQDVRQCSAPQVPRVWADLRQKQVRRHREWEQIQREKGGSDQSSEKPEPVDSDTALMQKHLHWCKSVVEDAIAAHQNVAPKSS